MMRNEAGVKHVPNILTIVRLALTPFLFYILWQHQYSLVIELFIAIALTDIADGFIARHFNAKSALGAILDPIADKALLSGIFLEMAIMGDIERWLVVAVLGRDLLILAGAGALYMAGSRRKFPPSVWGKLSTFVQVLFVCFRLGVLADIHVEPVAIGLKWLVLALAAVSFGDYVYRMLPNQQTEV
jgi:cardiolipin synthase (CMP-forming)